MIQLPRTLLLCLLLTLCGCAPESEPPAVTVATAANMQFALQAVAAAFTRQTGTEVRLVLGSSGKLTAQILEGAPYDLLVAADEQYPQAIFSAGNAEHPPRIYARGRLVLWSLTPGWRPAIESLTDPAIRHVALPNPELAPYGQAARQALQRRGVWDQVKTRLVFGESIAQTNQFILSRSADAGFTALSVVLSPQMQGRGAWTEIDTSWYSPIGQAAVLLKGADTPAAEFYTFLFSDAAAALLTTYGYIVPHHGLDATVTDF